MQTEKLSYFTDMETVRLILPQQIPSQIKKNTFYDTLKKRNHNKKQQQKNTTEAITFSL